MSVSLTDSAVLRAHLDRFENVRVLVLGDVMIDRYVHGTVERISPEAPIPVLRAERDETCLGGAGNVARNVAALGGRATLIGVVGQDQAGLDVTRLIRNESRIEARLVSDASRSTTEKMRFVSGHQQLLRADREEISALPEVMEGALIECFEDALSATDIVVLSDYAKGVLSRRVLTATIDLATRFERPIIADPKSVDLQRYRGVELLTPNRQELAAASPIAGKDDSSIVAAAELVMRSCGIEAVLVTRGERGMTLVRREGEPRHFRARAREVFDVTGAGDTVVATLAVALGAGCDLPAGAELANVAAGIVVGKAGAAVIQPGELAGALDADAALRATDSKIIALAEALRRIAGWRARGGRIGFTNGCFDLLHAGHVALLAQARAACDHLIVGLNADASVRRLKGAGRPVQDLASRATIMASLGTVDLVVPFEEDTPIDMIHAIRPDVLVKGDDYRVDQVVGAAFVASHGGRVLLVPLVPGSSTSRTIARIGGA